jgi:hypothetical protein
MTHPWPTFLMVAYIVEGSSALTTDRSLSMIWASLMVLIRRSTCLEGAGFAAAGGAGLGSAGFAREAAADVASGWAVGLGSTGLTV